MNLEVLIILFLLWLWGQGIKTNQKGIFQICAQVYSLFGQAQERGRSFLEGAGISVAGRDQPKQLLIFYEIKKVSPFVKFEYFHHVLCCFFEPLTTKRCADKFCGQILGRGRGVLLSPRVKPIIMTSEEKCVLILLPLWFHKFFKLIFLKQSSWPKAMYAEHWRTLIQFHHFTF